MRGKLPIHALIDERKSVLSLKPRQLAQRCGFKNLAKGIRRLDELCDGHLDLPDLIKALSSALEVPAAVISQAIDDTRLELQERQTAERRAEEEAWRASFVPHAIVLTAERRPEPIFIAALLGVERLLVIHLDHSKPEQTFPQPAREGLTEKLAGFGSGVMPAFGSPTGFVVNFTPDRATEFDLSGNQIRMLDKAYRPGRATLRFR